MPVRVRKYTNKNSSSNRDGWEVDIYVTLPNGSKHRERKRAPANSKSAARRWGELRERELAIHGPNLKPKEVPTLAKFKDRFIDGHCVANRHKPSGIASKVSSFKVYLLPLLGRKKLNKINNEDIARLKRLMVDKKPATANNTLTTLSQTLKCAVEWGVIESMPATIKLLKTQKGLPKFYDFDEFNWMVEAARKIDERTLLVVLLGGEAGLRRGEIVALEWSDCDMRRGQINVQRSEWNGHVNETKGMECRVVPMTERLKAALKAHKHMRGDRILYPDVVSTPTNAVIRNWMRSCQRRAGVKATGGIHILRHTFCSHLAMRGANVLSIQKLAGHKNLQTTLRYMHLAPGETERAIRLLDGESPKNDPHFGEIVDQAPNVVPFRRRS